jgi:flagellar biosynthesis protein FlhG
MPALSRMDERRRELLIEGLAALENEHDFVLMDAPAGIGRGVIHLAQQADELLLVTTPEPPAIMDAYALLKAVAASRAGSIGQVRLIVNMVTHSRDAEQVHKRIADVAQKFLGIRVGLLGYVFCDGHVGRAVQRREPLLISCPHSQAAWCIRRLATAVLDGPQPAEKARFAFFRRLAQLFAAG